MRVLLAVVVLVGGAALARAQDAEQEAARQGWREENGKGVRLYNAGKYGEAAPCFERALPLAERGFGTESPQAATTAFNLGLQYRLLGQYTRAEPLLVRALAIREQVLGKDHPDTATALNNL